MDKNSGPKLPHTKTYKIIFGTYPKDIAAIIWNYFRPLSNNIRDYAHAGFYELCARNIGPSMSGLYGAILGDYPEIVRLLFDYKYAVGHMLILGYACENMQNSRSASEEIFRLTSKDYRGLCMHCFKDIKEHFQ